MTDTASSPPTRRVVGIVELLREAGKPLTTTDIAKALDIARATTSAIMAELESAGWAQRDGGLAYSIGPALGALRGAAEPYTGGVATGAVLSELARSTGCGVTMSLIGPDHLVVVDKRHGSDRIIPGFPTGQRIPLIFPVGAAVMPWRDAADQERWLSTARQPRADGAELLRRVRTSGFAIFRPNDSDAGLVEVLADLLGAVGAEILDPRVRARALRQLNSLTSRVYTPTEVRSTKTLPISYLAAPVFDDAGYARFEVQLGALRAEVSKTERDDYIAALRSAAQRIGQALNSG
ncbi:MAG: helix-turn-helix domain-containing protein [Mycobacterium sp.]|nr:helix-turn-helix domain-containing protein [Mycobacterium sp.]